MIRASLLLAWFVAVVSSADVGTGHWRATTWMDEPAYAAAADGWVATVSVARGRLVDLRRTGGGNLLYVPVPAPPFQEQFSIPWGGHMVWLGPQQRWVWPPPRAWEFSPAAQVVTEGGTLELILPHDDPALPAVSRRYAWREGALHCTVAWRGGAQHWFGWHILQLGRDWAIRLPTAPRDDVPQGFAIEAGKVVDRAPAPDAAWWRAGDGIGIRGIAGMPSRKYLAPAAPITVERGGVRLTLSPATSAGIRVGPGADGLEAQVMVGQDAHYIEIEQCSAMLDAADGAAATITILPTLLGAP